MLKQKLLHPHCLRWGDTQRIGMTQRIDLSAMAHKVGNRPVNMHIDQTSGHYWF